ncbi:hypothetical protein MRY87_07345 [bacterium]|nr:hypothetical protein [bacterium]
MFATRRNLPELPRARSIQDESQSFEALDSQPKTRLHFLPFKAEIARIFTAAQELHHWRVEQGHKRSDDPIQILEVGGGGGTLARAILEIAGLNDIALKITNVEPRTFSNGLSHPCYDQFVMTSSEYLDLCFCEESELRADYRRLVALLEEGEKTFNADYDPETDRPEEPYRAELMEAEEKVRGHFRDRETCFDIVLNSWMPLLQNFSRDLELCGGAGIVYALSSDGATGVPTPKMAHDLEHQIQYAWQGNSYAGSPLYHNRAVWMNVSSAQARHASWLRPTERRNPPFSGAVLVQTRADISQPLDLSTESLDLGQPYSWEAELTERTGPITPVHNIPDSENFDYFRFFQEERARLIAKRR